MRRLILAVAGILMMITWGCEKYIIEKPEIEEGISFSTAIQPFFDAKCASCHSGSLSPTLTEGNSFDVLVNDGYLNIDNPESSEIYTTLRSGAHDSRATEEEKLTLLQWITEGALNN